MSVKYEVVNASPLVTVLFPACLTGNEYTLADPQVRQFFPLLSVLHKKELSKEKGQKSRAINLCDKNVSGLAS